LQGYRKKIKKIKTSAEGDGRKKEKARRRVMMKDKAKRGGEALEIRCRNPTQKRRRLLRLKHGDEHGFETNPLKEGNKDQRFRDHPYRRQLLSNTARRGTQQ
jgi:hypothetical protein